MTPTSEQKPQRAIPAAPTRRELRSHLAVRHYTLFCSTALFVLVVCLADRGLGWLALVPALIGGAALLAHWITGPPAVLLSLTILISATTRPPWRYPHSVGEFDQMPALMDLILCVAVLAYVLGFYRLLALIRHVFPPDPRRLPGSGFADPARRRSADLVSAREMVLLLVSLGVWTSLAVVVWSWIVDDAAPLGMPKEVWCLLRLAWGGLTLAAVLGVAAGYLRQARATPEESLLYLQDQLWRHTRSQQGILQRWLARARLRAQRKKVGS